MPPYAPSHGWSMRPKCVRAASKTGELVAGAPSWKGCGGRPDAAARVLGDGGAAMGGELAQPVGRAGDVRIGQREAVGIVRARVRGDLVRRIVAVADVTSFALPLRFWGSGGQVRACPTASQDGLLSLVSPEFVSPEFHTPRSRRPRHGHAGRAGRGTAHNPHRRRRLSSGRRRAE